jgi:hypothetical protein
MLKKSLGLLFVLVTVVITLLIPGGAALAKPEHHTDHHFPFPNNGDVPKGSKLVLNTVIKITNDEDSGMVGYWALDSYVKTVQVWKTPEGTYYADVKYVGTWQTFKGALSPEKGVLQAKDGTGMMNGGYTATFTAAGVVQTFGSFGNFGNFKSYDFGGTKADVLLGTYAAGQTGSTAPVSWLSTFFTGADNFEYIHWGWTYRYWNQTWNNFDTGSTGDIVIK